MRSLHYKETYQKLLTPEIVSCLAQIHEQKGQQNLFIEAHKDAMSELLEIAKMLLPLRSCFQHSRKPLPAGIAALVLSSVQYSSSALSF